MNKLFLITILTFLFCFSCSSDEMADLTPAEKMVGSWEGEFLQDDFGVATLSISISDLRANQRVGTANYGPNDLSQCNDIFFDCDFKPESCTASWIFISATGSTILFDEIEPSNDNCTEGIVTLTFTDDDTVSYKWVDVTDDSNVARGMLSRK